MENSRQPRCPICLARSNGNAVDVERGYAKDSSRTIFECEECGVLYTYEGLYDEDALIPLMVREDDDALEEGFMTLNQSYN